MPRFAVLAATLITLGAGTAYAGDTLLYSPMLSAPVGGWLECHATNVGKKPLAQVYMAMFGSGGSSGHLCYDLPPQSSSGFDATCSETRTGSAVCVVTITGGSHRSVRAVLNVVDSSGATILSVPATK